MTGFSVFGGAIHTGAPTSADEARPVFYSTAVRGARWRCPIIETLI